jgi:hypothetical protein
MLKIANSLRSDMLFSYAFFHSLNCFLYENSQLLATLFHHYLPSNYFKKDFELIPLLRDGQVFENAYSNDVELNFSH